MGFRGVNFAALAKFNSAASSELLTFYDAYVSRKLQLESMEPKSHTFAPSSFRCRRKSWFRLRGVETDMLKIPDRVLEFKAEMGIACHQVIQTNLKAALGPDWVEVPDFLKEHPIPYEYKLETAGLETRVAISDPPIRFACDGIIKWKGNTYLLEIKTADYASFADLTDPKSVHLDQIACYSAILNLPDVLVIYQDRQNGDIKCYEKHIASDTLDSVIATMRDIQKMAQCNLAPDKLPSGDYMCNNCEYKVKCSQW